MNLKAKIGSISKKILPILRPMGVNKIALFGSVVREEDTAESDVDILVDLKPSSQRKPLGLKWFGVERELSQVLGRPVDLVSTASLSPYIKPHIEKEMVILHEER